MTELQLVENKELRQKYIGELDILDKVKGLIMFPNTQIVTTEQLAEYYEIPVGTLKSSISENRAELLENGMITLKGAELKKFKGEIGNPTTMTSVSAFTIFNKRAVLNLGLLLRDSPIAKKLREVILDSASNKEVSQVIIARIDEEKQLMLNVLMASSDEEQVLALKSWKNYKDAKFNIVSMERKIAVEKVEHLTNSDATFGLRELIANIGVKEKNFKEYVLTKGYMYRQMKSKDEKGKPTGRLKAHAQYTKEPTRYCTDIVTIGRDEISHTNTVFTIDGVEYFRKLKEEIMKVIK